MSCLSLTSRQEDRTLLYVILGKIAYKGAIIMVKNKKSLKHQIFETIFLLSMVFCIRTYGFGLYQVPSGSMETTMLTGERYFADKLSYNFRVPQRNEIISFNQPPTTYPYSDNKLVNRFQHYVYGPANWTKRVIGQPGDEIRGTIEDDKPIIYRNGERLHEPYVNPYPLVYVASEENLNDIHPKTIDPSRPLQDQPFYYRIQKSKIVSDLIYPDVAQHSKFNRDETDQNYWDGSDEFHIKLGKDQYWLMGDNRKGSKDSRVFGPVSRGFIHGRILYRIWSIDSDEPWWILDFIKHPIDFWKRVRFDRCIQTVQ